MTDSSTDRNEGGSWRLRRNLMFATVAFCAIIVVYVLWKELDSRVAETAMTMAFTIIGSTVASYVFGATWEDINSRKHKHVPRRANHGDYPRTS